jgi:hypothetical protein
LSEDTLRQLGRPNRYGIVTVATAQDPKKARRKKGPRIWIEASRLEQKAVRVVAKHKGYARGYILRMHSLNDILEMYRQLTDGK